MKRICAVLLALAACNSPTGPDVEQVKPAPVAYRTACELPGHNSGPECARLLAAWAAASTSALGQCARLQAVGCVVGALGAGIAGSQWAEGRDAYGHRNSYDAGDFDPNWPRQTTERDDAPHWFLRDGR